jgi:hypothetical protein
MPGRERQRMPFAEQEALFRLTDDLAKGLLDQVTPGPIKINVSLAPNPRVQAPA